MAQVINTNVMSLNAQRNLSTTSASMATTVQRLSSGLRINSAKDDAAGLAIAQRMTTQVRGMEQAARNANDGISLAQTAEGALQEISNNLQRIRELAVQAANGTNSTEDKAALQKEVQALKDEITRVTENTKFNGIHLLNTSGTVISIQVGANATDHDMIDIKLNDIKTALSGITASSFSVSGMTAGSGATQLTNLDDALKAVNEARADLGAIQNRFSSAIANLQVSTENMAASRSRIQDADYAKETAELTRNQILQQAGTAMLAQAKAIPQNVLSLLQ
ncbi:MULTISPECIES: flagellin [Pseudoxanthomonas]|uniref:Flagellin n=1 Tax=Pseudoxanthomonas taiwanensis J19 TaxID=935569 RepID=A0A562DIX6_9GAMM|nr:MULTISPECIES: flagellin [Pseudoxanthomonas]TWH09608.1 flagellin [Pseudoxanthomonas taiwanensis J19]